jgi:hypothetical protein
MRLPRLLLAAGASAHWHHGNVSKHANVLCNTDELFMPPTQNGLRSDEVAWFLMTNAALYCERVLPMVNAWGRSFPHVYAVFANATGKPEGDYRHEVTRAMARERHGRMGRDCAVVDGRAGSWLVRRCGDARVRPVLVAGYCRNPTHRGPGGPCCRANAAMQFFLDRAGTTFRRVKWWVFSDDDVYARSVALLGVLAAYDAAAPLNVAASPTAIAGYARPCAGPARQFVANKPWQVVSGLSRAALLAMEDGVYQRGASAQCDALGFDGHDEGIGFFYWMHAIPTVLLAPWAYRGRALFDAGDIFREEHNLSEAAVRGALDGNDTEPVRAALSRFLFFHNALHPPDMFRLLRRVGDDELDVAPAAAEASPVIRAPGFECTAYAARRRNATTWAPFTAADCAAPLVAPCACARGRRLDEELRRAKIRAQRAAWRKAEADLRARERRPTPPPVTPPPSPAPSPPPEECGAKWPP